MGHELALYFLLVGIKVFDHPKITTYIIYLKTVSLKNTYQTCQLFPNNSKI